MTMVFLRMASMYFFWPSVFALTGLPFAVMHSTSRLIVWTSLSRPSFASPMTYCTVCVPMDSPRPAIASSAVIARAAMDNAFVLAGDFQLGSAADDRDVQFALDLLDVFVKCTEYCHQQFGLLDLHYLFYGYTLLNSSYIIFVGRGALTPPNVDSSATFIP